MNRSASWKIVPTKEKKGWKAIKSKDADCGSYQFHKSKDYTLHKDPNHAFPKSKSDKFTVEYAKKKKHVPGTGHYKPEKGMDMISKPYSKKRF